MYLKGVGSLISLLHSGRIFIDLYSDVKFHFIYVTRHRSMFEGRFDSFSLYKYKTSSEFRI